MERLQEARRGQGLPGVVSTATQCQTSVAPPCLTLGSGERGGGGGGGGGGDCLLYWVDLHGEGLFICERLCQLRATTYIAQSTTV